MVELSDDQRRPLEALARYPNGCASSRSHRSKAPPLRSPASNIAIMARVVFDGPHPPKTNSPTAQILPNRRPDLVAYPPHSRQEKAPPKRGQSLGVGTSQPRVPMGSATADV
jgi:hypothetical protein